MQARAFSHSNIELTFLEKKKLRGKESRNKELLLETIGGITIANVKGGTLIRGLAGQQSLISIEGFKKLGDTIDPNAFSLTETLMNHSKSISYKLTQSSMQKLVPKVSLKIIQTANTLDIND